MDPRKTVRIADLDRAVRESRPIIIARPVIAVGKPERAASLTQTLVWGSCDAGKPPSSPFGERTTLNDLKAASSPTLAEELEARVHELSRPRTKVELETQEVQRLAAEVWASQPSIGLQTMAQTWRDQPLDRAMVPPAHPPERELVPELAPDPDPFLPARLSTDALSPIGRIFRRLQLQRSNLGHSDFRPRRHALQLPASRALRFACGALTALCLTITSLSISGKLDAGTSAAPPAKVTPARAPAARSGHASDPAAAEIVRKPEPAAGVVPVPAATPQPAAASGPTPRSAVDALMAGKHDLALQRYRALAQSSPSNPAYAAAARILADSEQSGAQDP